MTIEAAAPEERLTIAILGAGRVGGAMEAYARALGHEARAFGRAATASGEAADFLARADRLALAVPDDALDAVFAAAPDALKERGAVFHFSGARLLPGAPACHPLYSFPKAPLAPGITATIAIAVEPGAPAFSVLLPGAPNPSFEVAAADRAFYHALAVLTGNYAAFLWNAAAGPFEDRLGVPAGPILAPYLAGVVERFAEAPRDSMTGPLARGDVSTISANRAALGATPALLALYDDFLARARPDLVERDEAGPDRD